MALDEAQPSDCAALLLPGGVMNPDYLRWNPRAVAFVKGFVDNSKPIAAICHGPWTLIEAGAVRKRLELGEGQSMKVKFGWKARTVDGTFCRSYGSRAQHCRAPTQSVAS